jgi:hypothetical protein
MGSSYCGWRAEGGYAQTRVDVPSGLWRRDDIGDDIGEIGRWHALQAVQKSSPSSKRKVIGVHSSVLHCGVPVNAPLTARCQTWA